MTVVGVAMATLPSGRRICMRLYPLDFAISSNSKMFATATKIFSSTARTLGFRCAELAKKSATAEILN